MVLLVTPADMLGWSFVEEVAVGAGTMEEGPGAPPSGTGSAALVVDGEGREVLASSAYVGTRFADISTLRYFTWQDADSPGSDIYAVSLQFDVDYDLDDADPSTASRLVYEPYYLGGVVKGEWQAWDTMDGLWWAVKEPGLSLCPQSAPCTWDEVVLAFPSAGIGGEVVLKAGGPWSPGFSGNVDALTIGVGGVEETWDFETRGADDDTGEPGDSGDSGGGDSGGGDSGGGDSGAGDSGGPGDTSRGDSGSDDPDAEGSQTKVDVEVSCGCRAAAGGGAAWWVSGLALVARARRR